MLSDIIAGRLNALHSMAYKNRMYLIDVVDVRALYWLASQFDVLGYKGWFLTTDEASRRQLIRTAIELNKYKGTPWAVKEAIRSLGFTNVELIERAGLIYLTLDGSWTLNGDEDLGGDDSGEWATFAVIIDASDFQASISPEYVTAIRALIDEYKNVRSHLVELKFKLTFDEDLAFEDDSDSSGGVNFEDELTGFNTYLDGTYTLDGGIDLDSTSDGLIITGGEEPPPATGTVEMTYTGTSLTFSMFDRNLIVDWGDGTVETFSPSPSVSHTYATSGTYNVVVTADDISTSQFWADGISAFSTDMDMISLALNNSLTTLNIDSMPSLSNIQLNGNQLTSSVLNEIVQRLDANGLSNGLAQLQQSPTALITGDGITAVINLLDKDWTVAFDS